MSTFPRNGSHRNPGNACFNCTVRRKLDVPIRALAGSPSRVVAELLTSASRGSARGSTAAISSPSGSTAGTSFIECTAISASPDSSTVSSSLTKTPLPPSVLSETSCLRSPSVERPITSTSVSGESALIWRATSFACHWARMLFRVVMVIFFTGSTIYCYLLLSFNGQDSMCAGCGSGPPAMTSQQIHRT